MFPTDFTRNQGTLANEHVIGNQHRFSTSTQMGIQIREYVGDPMDQFVSQNVVDQKGNDCCFMTSIQKPTSAIHSSVIGRNFDKVEKIQYLLMLANKEKSRILLTAEENEFRATTRINDNSADLNETYNFMANQQATTSSSDSDLPPTYDSDPFHEVPNYGNDANPFAHKKPHYVPLEPNYDTYVGEQVNSNVNYENPDMDPNGVQVAQNDANDEETRAFFESLLNNCSIEIEKVKKVNREVKAANEKLTTEPERYKENAKCFQIHKERESELEIGYKKLLVKDREWKNKFDTLEISSTKTINSLKQEISELTNQLSKQKTAYTNLEKERDELKKDFAKKEDKLLDEIIESEHKIAHLEELVVKSGQSSQTMKMISNQTNPIYHTKHKMALGNNNPCNLKKAQQEDNVLYNGNVIYTKHDPLLVRDSVQMMELVEESITKMKQKDLKPIDYNKLNKLSGITFFPQKEPSVFSIKRPFSKIVSKKVVASKSLSNMEQMSSNNTFNTSAASGYLDDLKTRVGQLKLTLESKTRLNEINWNSTVHLQLKKILESDFAPPINAINVRVIHFEQAFLKETADFVKDHKSLVKEANANLQNIKLLENLNDSLFEVVMTTDIMPIILQSYSVEEDERLRAETSEIVSKYENALVKLEKENMSFFKQLNRKSEECKYDKLSYEHAYKEDVLD